MRARRELQEARLRLRDQAGNRAIAYMDGWKFAILTYELPAGVGMQRYEVYLDGKLVASGGTDEVPQGSLLLHYQHTVEPRYTVLIPATATAPELRTQNRSPAIPLI